MVVSMKKKELCIVHIGMPKTGSTAIQEYFFTRKIVSNVSYANLSESNHSGRVVSSFIDNPQSYQYIYKSNISDILLFKEKNLAMLEEGFLTHKTNIELISGEDIYHMPTMSPLALVRFKNFLDNFFEEVLIIAYVRPVSSFLSSAFQQLVKYHDLGDFSVNKIYHRYSNFKAFFDVFGEENVKLFLFSPQNFPNNDIVIDFCNRINANCDVLEKVSVNETVPKSTIAVLFCYHYHSKSKSNFGLKKSSLDILLVELLSNLKSDKFRFSGQFIWRAITANQEDYDWIVSVMGEEFKETPESLSAEGVDSEDELMHYAVQYIPNLVELAGDFAKDLKLDDTPQTVARLVDKIMLRLAHDHR